MTDVRLTDDEWMNVRGLLKQALSVYLGNENIMPSVIFPSSTDKLAPVDASHTHRVEKRVPMITLKW